MAESNSRKRITVIIQLIILVLFCGGVAALAYVFGVFNPPKEYRNVTLRVENPAGTVQLIYSIPGESVKDPQQVSTPWEKTLAIKVGSEIYVTAVNPSNWGDTRCTVLLDGKGWKKDTAVYPSDKVFCAGIIP